LSQSTALENFSKARILSPGKKNPRINNHPADPREQACRMLFGADWIL
jgi:hypothetical protein